MTASVLSGVAAGTPGDRANAHKLEFTSLRARFGLGRARGSRSFHTGCGPVRTSAWPVLCGHSAGAPVFFVGPGAPAISFSVRCCSRRRVVLQARRPRGLWPFHRGHLAATQLRGPG
jgi:hypothetical protein